MSKAHILVVEDEEDILELVRFNLEKEGFRVETAPSGEECLKKLDPPPDLLVLDLMLPGLNGLEVCRLLRQRPETKTLPIIMITARGEEADVITGLDTGADDYLPKPFSPRILLARIKALLRRGDERLKAMEAGANDKSSNGDKTLSLHGISINPGKREVKVNGKVVQLTYSEFNILHILAGRPGWVFSRQQIVDMAKGQDYHVTERAVDVQIVSLRKKLNPLGKVIQTVRGVGYRLQESGEEAG